MQLLQPSTCCPTTCDISTTTLAALIAEAVADASVGCQCSLPLVEDLMDVQSPLVENRFYYVQGQFAVDDGLGGIWVTDLTSTATHDGYAVIQPTAITGAGRLLKRL